MADICPRCGLAGSAVIKKVYGRRYIYFAHYIPSSSRDSKKKKVKFCYVGPAEGYEVVDGVYMSVVGELGLDNIADVDWIKIAVNAIRNYTIQSTIAALTAAAEIYQTMSSEEAEHDKVREEAEKVMKETIEQRLEKLKVVENEIKESIEGARREIEKYVNMGEEGLKNTISLLINFSRLRVVEEKLAKAKQTNEHEHIKQ